MEKEKTKQVKKEEQKEEPKEKKEKEVKEKKEEKALAREKREKEIKHISLIRIAATDIPGRLSVYAGLTKIKGISWALSNAVCISLVIDKNRKISSLTEQEIEKIKSFLKNPEVPSWLLNRRKDFETGTSKHLITIDLDLQREFDIRRLKKIRSYRGIRHSIGLPVRGQRTRAHFRKGRAVGVSRAKVKPSKGGKVKKK